MTGPEHYHAAEKLLEENQEHPSSSINKNRVAHRSSASTCNTGTCSRNRIGLWEP